LGSPASRAEPVDECFTVHVRFEAPLHVVVMSGELDCASRAAAVRACTAAGHLEVVVDMAGMVFMDCSGYGALVESRTILERRNGSLSLSNPQGEPLRLLSLIECDERDPDVFARFERSRLPSPVVVPS
jgi:anti-anti-sigma factor